MGAGEHGGGGGGGEEDGLGDVFGGDEAAERGGGDAALLVGGVVDAGAGVVRAIRVVLADEGGVDVARGDEHTADAVTA